MDYGIILFVYNRPVSTQKVLDSLKANNIKSLYIFQDGLKEGSSADGWNETSRLIHAIDWCETKIFVSETNKGLAQSIIDGVTAILSTEEAVIVIEDDCVLHQDYIHFMECCFEQYRDNQSVMAISGYRWPITLPKDYALPIYASYRISSWGWGTWRDRWKWFRRDYTLMTQIKKDPEAARILEDYGGIDVGQMLIGNLIKETSWAVFWTLTCMLHKGINIQPVHNLVAHIGYGNEAGVHLGSRTVFEMDLDGERHTYYDLPKDVTVHPEITECFKRMLRAYRGNTTADKQRYYREGLQRWVELLQNGETLRDKLLQNGVTSCVLFGKNQETKLLIAEIGSCITIEYIMASEAEPGECFLVYPVFSEVQPDKENRLLIVIPGFDKPELTVIKGLAAFDRVLGFQELFE